MSASRGDWPTAARLRTQRNITMDSGVRYTEALSNIAGMWEDDYFDSASNNTRAADMFLSWFFTLPLLREQARA